MLQQTLSQQFCFAFYIFDNYLNIITYACFESKQKK